MYDPTPETDKLKAELLQMADRKAEIEALLWKMKWPEGKMRIEDEYEKAKLDNINFYDFEYWSPSSINC